MCSTIGRVFYIWNDRRFQRNNLEGKSPILFGHPFAKTSYPLYKVNNSWGKIEDFCKLEDCFFTVSSSKITYTCPAKMCTFIINYDLTEGASGKFSITTEIVNTTNDSIKNIQYAIVIDPGMGISSGDGEIQGENALKECKFAKDSVLIKEQCSGGYGMYITADFMDPAELFITNWNTIKNSEKSGAPALSGQLIYDLCVKALYSEFTIAPNMSYSKKVQFEYKSSKESANLFVRWDIPRFISLQKALLIHRIFKVNVSFIIQPALLYRQRFHYLYHI